jgi:hypothetical protein
MSSSQNAEIYYSDEDEDEDEVTWSDCVIEINDDEYWDAYFEVEDYTQT